MPLLFLDKATTFSQETEGEAGGRGGQSSHLGPWQKTPVGSSWPRGHLWEEPRPLTRTHSPVTTWTHWAGSGGLALAQSTWLSPLLLMGGRRGRDQRVACSM